MKNFCIYLFSVYAVCLLGGCALITPPPYNHSETTIVRDSDGKIVESKYTRKTIGLSYNDPETSQTWSYSDQIARQSAQQPGGSAGSQPAQEYVLLRVRNCKHSYGVIIRSAPFNGLTLVPGEVSTNTYPIPVGIYPLTYSYYKIGGERGYERTINVSVPRGRTEPIEFR